MLSQKMNGSQLTSLAAVLFADGLLNREMSSQENKELTFVRTKVQIRKFIEVGHFSAIASNTCTTLLSASSSLNSFSIVACTNTKIGTFFFFVYNNSSFLFIHTSWQCLLTVKAFVWSRHSFTMVCSWTTPSLMIFKRKKHSVEI